MTPEDRDVVRDIERTLGSPIERRRIAGFNYDEPAAPAVRTRDSRFRPSARPQANRPRGFGLQVRFVPRHAGAGHRAL